MYFCKNWEKTKKRFEAFWHGDYLDRAIMRIETPRDGSNYKPPVPNAGELECFYTDPNWMIERNVQRFENTYYTGDGYASIWIRFATGGHCCYAKGSKIEYTDRTVWVHPSIYDWEADFIEFDKNSPLLKQHEHLLSCLCAEAKGRYMVGNYDHCGNLDALASLRGSSELLMDFLTEPDRVKEGIRKIQEMQKYSMKRFWDIQLPSNGGTVNAWMGTFCEQRHIQVQCDLSVMISREIFEEFALPDLEFYNDWPGKSIYHLDGQEQLRHLDMILSVKGLDGIQWTPVDGQPRTSHFLPELKRIQAAGKLLVVFPYPEEVELLSRELSHKGLFMKILGVRNQAEADHLLKIVEQNAHT